MAQPTANDQYLIELINQIRANPEAAAKRYNVSLGNNTASPKEPLALSLQLTEAAQAHSQDMLQGGFFSHNGANGSRSTERIEAAGFPLQTFRTPQNQLWSYGENISAKPLEDIDNPNPTVTAQDVENHIYWAAAGGGWMPSSGHRDTILREGYKEIGVGVANGPYARYGNKSYSLATANFGTQDIDGVDDTQNLDQAFLTGVAFNDEVTDDDFYTPGEGLGNIRIKAVRKSDNREFTTQTFGSGGYSLGLSPGNYQVTFSGGGLSKSVSETVNIGNRNIKLDLDTDARGIVAGPSPVPNPNPSPSPEPTPEPTPEPEPDLTPPTPTPEPDIVPTPTGANIGPDFNGDGQTDILWQNTSNRRIMTWLMDGTKKQRRSRMGRVPKGFEVRAVGDFNGDDQDDLILQDSKGQVEAWFLDGTRRNGSQTIF